MKLPDYIALKKPGEEFYTWYDKNTFGGSIPRYDTEASKYYADSMGYQPTGELITRDDGQVAEVWEPLPSQSERSRPAVKEEALKLKAAIQRLDAWQTRWAPSSRDLSAIKDELFLITCRLLN